MTFDYESATAREIIDHICEDGKVTLDEVTALDKLLNDDWVISKDEAELLFQINSQVGGDQISQWQELFVSAISRFDSDDLGTPVGEHRRRPRPYCHIVQSMMGEAAWLSW